MRKPSASCVCGIRAPAAGGACLKRAALESERMPSYGYKTVFPFLTRQHAPPVSPGFLPAGLFKCPPSCLVLNSRLVFAWLLCAPRFSPMADLARPVASNDRPRVWRGASYGQCARPAPIIWHLCRLLRAHDSAIALCKNLQNIIFTYYLAQMIARCRRGVRGMRGVQIASPSPTSIQTEARRTAASSVLSPPLPP